MRRSKKIPLEERLKSAGNDAPLFLAAFEVHPEDYLKTLTELSNMPYFKESFDTAFESCPELSNCLLEQMVYLAAQLPDEQRCALYYRLLVEPFGILRVFNGEDNDE